MDEANGLLKKEQAGLTPMYQTVFSVGVIGVSDYV